MISRENSVDTVLYKNFLLFGPYETVLFVCDLDLNHIQEIHYVEDDKYVLSNNFMFIKKKVFDTNKFEKILDNNVGFSFDNIICSSRYIVCEEYQDKVVEYTLYDTKSTKDIYVFGTPIMMIDDVLYVKKPHDIELQIPKTKESECCICFEEITERYVLTPCGHTNTCKSCHDKNKSKRCAICRTKIKEYVKLFI